MNVNKRERILLLATVAIAVLAGFQMLVLRPLMGDSKGARVRTALSVRESARLRAVTDQAAAYEKAFADIRERVTTSDSVQREIITMLLAIESLAEDSGVEILENSHLKDESLEYFDRHTVRFRGAGDTEQLTRFLHAVQNSELLFKIRTMKLRMKNNRLESELEIVRLGIRDEVEP
ncbi:MAG: hypothetical protein RLY93_02900 [Sumerlaeia bacterium]